MCCYFPHFYALEIFLSIYNPGNPGHFPLVFILKLRIRMAQNSSFIHCGGKKAYLMSQPKMKIADYIPKCPGNNNTCNGFPIKKVRFF